MFAANAKIVRFQKTEAMLTKTLEQMQSVINEDQIEVTSLRWNETDVRDLVNIVVKNDYQLLLKFKKKTSCFNGKQLKRL